MSKLIYNELRKKLRDEFTVITTLNNYAVVGGVGLWVKQCGVQPNIHTLNIICNIFGAIPYPYQATHRRKILGYLKNNKYKQYKKDYKNEYIKSV